MQRVCLLGCFSSTGGNHEGPEAGECAPGHGLPSHLSHHHREALLVNPEVQPWLFLALTGNKKHPFCFENTQNSSVYVPLFSWLLNVHTCLESSSTCTSTKTTWTSSLRWRMWTGPASICLMLTFSLLIGQSVLSQTLKTNRNILISRN